MSLSIIIPTLNEEENIGRLLQNLRENTTNNTEIIIVDGGSIDNTLFCITNQVNLKIINIKEASRAKQMNLGAKLAENEVLLFLHADVLPPSSFQNDIMESIAAKNDSGWFSYKFKPSKSLLKINEYFTGKDGVFAGGGDQCLFIKKSVFESLGGFNEDYVIMEDFELIKRLKKQNFQYQIIQSKATVSSRKYEKNSWLRVNLVNLLAFLMFLSKQNPQKIKTFYAKALS